MIGDYRKIEVDLIAFDADDTLWHNEGLFYSTQDRFKEILARYHSEEWIGQRLVETEIRNIRQFGYGVKGFNLSMIETAIELSEGRVSAGEIQSILEMGKDMMQAPVELLDGVSETIEMLAQDYELMIITKGDLFHQESKIARSGLGGFFGRIEIVSEKDTVVYDRILTKYGIMPERFLMVGNSLKSDILPVVEVGGKAVYVPYRTTWVHEQVSEDAMTGKEYFEIEQINRLPALLTGAMVGKT